MLLLLQLAQSVQRLDKGLTAEGSEFESRKLQDFSIFHVLWSHQALNTMDSGSSFSEGKAAGA
jgi:hypothetical protein